MVNLTRSDTENPAARAIERGRALAELGGRQHGVVARRQLVALGLDRGAIDWQLRSGRLHGIHRGVYALGPAAPSQRGLWLAAVLSHGNGAVLSHLSAAALWGLLRARGPIDVTSHQGRPGRQGIRLHRCGLEQDEAARKDRIPMTTVARTLLDLAQSAGDARVRSAWEEADRLGLLRLRSVEAICHRHHSRSGVRTIRALLEEATWATVTRSPLEDRVLALCRDQGLPTPVTNVDVLGREVDAYWPDAGLVVEADSFEFHRHRGAFERDRIRDAAMQSAGYRVIRLTHRRLDSEAETVADQLRKLLQRSS